MSKPLPGRSALSLLLVALLLFLLAGTVTRTAKDTETETTFTVTAEAFEGFATKDLSATRAEGGLRFEKTGENPTLFYNTDAPGDEITLSFAAPLKSSPRLYYCTDGDRDPSMVLYTPRLLEDGCSYRFYLPVGNDANHFEIRFEESFTLVSLSHETVGAPGTAYRFNPAVAVALLALLGLLLLLEKRLGFFAEVRDFFLRERDRCRSLQGAKRILHLACLAVFLAFCALAFLDLALSLTRPVFAFLLWGLGLLSIAALLLEGLYLRTDLSFAKLFWLIALVLGAAFALALPTTTRLSWDDEFHLAHMACHAAFLTGDGLPFSFHTLISSPPLSLPYFENTEQFAATLLRQDAFSAPPAAFSLPDLHPLLWVLGAPFALLYAAYRYLVYLPGILICLFCFLVDADVIFTTTVCRLFMTALTTTLFAFGIRRLLYGKRLFAVVALLPCAFYLSVNFSCDGFISSLLALAFAYFIGELQRPNEPLSKKNAAIMLIAAALGCSPKPIYFILLLPFLFLPKSKFAGEKRARAFKIITVLVMLIVAMTFVLPFLINPDTYTDLRGGADVSAVGQIKYILANPFTFLDTLFRFLGEYVSLSAVAPYTVFFAYLHQGTAILGTLYLVLLFFVAFADRRRNESWDLSVRPLSRAVGLLTVFFSVCLVILSLYVGFTPVGADTVSGCQFRYAFPLFPLFFYFLGSVKLRSFISERKMTLLALGGGALLNLLLFSESILVCFR